MCRWIRAQGGGLLSHCHRCLWHLKRGNRVIVSVIMLLITRVLVSATTRQSVFCVKGQLWRRTRIFGGLTTSAEQLARGNRCMLNHKAWGPDHYRRAVSGFDLTNTKPINRLQHWRFDWGPMFICFNSFFMVCLHTLQDNAGRDQIMLPVRLMNKLICRTRSWLFR